MSWERLLDPTRVRTLMENQASVKTPGELRSEFERDRDRTVYSAPVRRLIGKTQVFPLDPNDHVRTRLVHSLEVSTVAEGLAAQAVRKVIQDREKELTEDHLRAIPKIAETCGLLHDVGNPPFGHAGELAMGSWFVERERTLAPRLGGRESQRFKDLALFEGNAQTMRIATNVHLLGHDYGLNLTCATTAAARKYLAPSVGVDKYDHLLKKPGYFKSETAILERVAEKTGTNGRRHPVTFLVEAADDIVYSVVDLEDGLKKRKLTWPATEEYLNKHCGGELLQRVLDQTRRQVGPNASDTDMGQAFRVNAISATVCAAVDIFELRYDSIMEGGYRGELIEDPEYSGKPLIAACKGLLCQTVFRGDEILRLEVRGRRVLHDLLELFSEGALEFLEKKEHKTATYGGKLYLSIAESGRCLFERRIEDGSSDEDQCYAAMQMVADYVSGMTDGFACRLHKDLMNG